MKISSLFIYGICYLFLLTQGLLKASDSDLNERSPQKGKTGYMPPQPSMALPANEIAQELDRLELSEKIAQAKAQRLVLEGTTKRDENSSATANKRTLTPQGKTDRTQGTEGESAEKKKRKKEQDHKASASVEQAKRIIQAEGLGLIEEGGDMPEYFSSTSTASKKTTFVKRKRIDSEDLTLTRSADQTPSANKGSTSKQKETKQVEKKNNGIAAEKASASVGKMKRIMGEGKNIQEFLSSIPTPPKKTSFVAPRRITAGELILMMGVGRRAEGTTTKNNKIFLMHEQGQMVAGFKIMELGKEEDFKGWLQLHKFTGGEEFEYLKNSLLILTYPVNNLIKFTKEYCLSLQQTMFSFEKIVLDVCGNLFAQRVDDEARPADTLGDARKSIFGSYELVYNGNPIPEFRVKLVFSVKK